jgi:hypothetical protein
MLLKKSTLTVENRRSVTTFFNRITEQFERKFDGFPAAVQGNTAELTLDPDTTGVNIGDLIDKISGEFLDSQTPQCEDISGAEADSCLSDPDGCSGKSYTEVLIGLGGDEYEASLPVDYFVYVWVDGLAAFLGEDYTVTESKTVLFNVDTTDAEIMARYVVA